MVCYTNKLPAETTPNGWQKRGQVVTTAHGETRKQQKSNERKMAVMTMKKNAKMMMIENNQLKETMRRRKRMMITMSSMTTKGAHYLITHIMIYIYIATKPTDQPHFASVNVKEVLAMSQPSQHLVSSKSFITCWF